MAVQNKKKRNQQKKKRAQNKIKKMEKQDSLGISRKKKKFCLNPKIFITLKVVSILAPIICYFFFSKGLFFCMLFSALLLIATFFTERYHNQSFIKSNHIKIPKFDSIIAIITMMITIAGVLMGANSKIRIGRNFRQSQALTKFYNVCTCLTGNRRIRFSKDKFGNMKPPSFDMNFGTANLPPNLPKPGERIPNFDFKDLPLESLFSTVTSTVITILIFAVPVATAIVLVLYYFKTKKFNKEMNDVIVDEFPELSEDDYLRIFTFDGVVVTENENTSESLETT